MTNTFNPGEKVTVTGSSLFNGWKGRVDHQSTMMVSVAFTHPQHGKFIDVPFFPSELKRREPELVSGCCSASPRRGSEMEYDLLGFCPECREHCEYVEAE